MNKHGKNGRLVGNESEAREWIAAWRSSGKGLSTWCREHDVVWYSLRHWSLKLGSKETPQLPQLVEVHLSKPAAPSSYEIGLVSGRTVKVTDTWNEDTLRRLIDVLESV